MPTQTTIGETGSRQAQPVPPIENHHASKREARPDYATRRESSPAPIYHDAITLDADARRAVRAAALVLEAAGQKIASRKTERACCPSPHSQHALKSLTFTATSQPTECRR
jgi:hypothetical protein